MSDVRLRCAWQFVTTTGRIILRHPMTRINIVPIFSKDGYIVLVMGRDTGEWTLPGGLVEWSESVPNAAKRELTKTTGLELGAIRNLVGVYSVQNQSEGHAICLTVEVEAKEDIRLENMREFSEAKAFKQEDFPNLTLSTYCSQQLKDYLQSSQQPQENAIYRFGNSSRGRIPPAPLVFPSEERSERGGRLEDKGEGCRLRHLFITWLGVIFRYPVVGATIIAILPDGKIVLVKRPKKSDREEEWGLPGGMVDWGEDIPATVSRELKEETGLNLVKIKRIVGVYSEAFRDPRVHSIALSVEVEAEGTFQVEDTLEIEEARAFTVEELRPKLKNMVLIHDHRRQLQDYFQGLTTIA